MEVFCIPVGAIQENCYILASQAKNAVLVDPGDNAPAIEKLLEEHGLAVKKFLLTHGHFDHIGAVKELAEKWNAPVYAAKKEEAMLSSAQHSRCAEPIVADVWLADGDKIQQDELEISVISTPGHSAGSVCYLCGDVMFSGDTLFAGDIGRCDLYSGNFAAMLKSLEKLKKLEGNYRVLPGHGPSSTLEKEKERNPYMTGEIL